MTALEYIDWPCPAPGGGTKDELALAFDRKRAARVLVLPAWFDEANKLRRQTVATMRRLDEAGIDSALPDLPGCNESLARLEDQTLDSWRTAAAAAAAHFRATHVLTVRTGALLAPGGLPGWRYAPAGGRQTLRGMIRARTIASKEAGLNERTEDLQDLARRDGIELAGWRIGADMFRALETTEPDEELAEIAQSAVGGGAPWLRAEPDYDPQQAVSLAGIVSAGIQP